jgi:drug/metabolite transporter (DMT)-like permease
MVAVALGLGTALCWGLADFLGGIRTRTLTLPLVLLVSQFTGLMAITLLIAFGSFETPSFSELLPAIGAGIGQVIGIAALYKALAIGKMSLISPISASGAALVPVVFALATGERPAAPQYAGMAAILVGVVLATRAPETGRSESPRRAVWLALLAAAGIGAFYVGMDASLDDAGPFWSLLAARTSAFALLAAVLLAVRPRLGAGRAALPSLALIGLLDIAANACFALGADTGLLSVVAVLASLYPAATVIMARAMLGERLMPIQAAGVVVALTGVAVIAAG